MANFIDNARQMGFGGPYSPLVLTPHALAGVRTRRMLAFCVDFIVVGILCGVLFPVASGILLAPLGPIGALGGMALSWLLLPTLFPVAAFFYNGIFVSSRGMGTPGMRLFDLQARSVDGGPVPFLHAALHGVCFYLTWLMPPLFLISLVTIDKSCLHDILAQVRVLRRTD